MRSIAKVLRIQVVGWYAFPPSRPLTTFMMKLTDKFVDFFTRRVHDSARPVASPEDDNIIANACESKVYHVAAEVRFRDKFWIKGQPYSITDMLASDPLAPQFNGGTVYQACTQCNDASF